MERMETDWIRSSTAEGMMAGTGAATSFLIRVQVYQGASCLSDKDFFKANVTIGSNGKADLVLKHPHIAGLHAYLYAENQQIFVVAPPHQKALHLNGKPVRAALLGLNDCIEIGPYTLKAQIRAAEYRTPIKDDIKYRVVFNGQIQKGHSPRRVAQVLKK
ncbi:MAG: FHA domain-containing protein, partial [Deltaproteobacteria bacterium]|nr:FHA domain-containing protein [Deltaproteobacteria bacterium]